MNTLFLFVLFSGEGIGYVDDNVLLRLHTELATMASSKHCSF